MPIVTHQFDYAGRPTIELYVGVSAAEAEFRPSGLRVPVRALVDIGASKTNIVRWVFDRLGLSPVGQILIHTASTGPTPSLTDVYAVEISLGGEKTGLLATDLEVAAAEDLSGSGSRRCSVETSWDAAYWSTTAWGADSRWRSSPLTKRIADPFRPRPPPDTRAGRLPAVRRTPTEFTPAGR